MLLVGPAAIGDGMQRVGPFRSKGVNIEGGFAGGARRPVSGARPQGAVVRFVVGDSFADCSADIAAPPVRESLSRVVGIDDALNGRPHIVDVRVVGVLQDQKLAGHGDAQVAALDVLQDEVGQLQNPQVVGQGGPGHAQLFGQCLNRQRCFVDGPLVGPDYFDLG